MSTTVNNVEPKRRVALSYIFAKNAPYPEGGQPLEITIDKSLADGDESNNSFIYLWNHLGTHIDGPSHMVANRGPLSDYVPATGLFLSRPLVVDVPCEQDNKLITAAELEQAMPKEVSCDILLLRTGFGHYRDSEPGRYSGKNPGLDSSGAQYIVEHCPGVVCVAIDSISFAAMAYVSEGIAAHRILLSNEPPIMLIEDANLDYDLSRLRRVIVVPLLIEGLDSCPCTVIGELSE